MNDLGQGIRLIQKITSESSNQIKVALGTFPFIEK
jgi:hypothetical protein